MPQRRPPSVRGGPERRSGRGASREQSVKSWAVVVVAVALLLVAVGAALLLVLLAQAPGEGESPEPSPVSPSRPAMAFNADGVAGQIDTAVERVVRPGNAQVAVSPRNGGRWVCIVVNGRERYFELDQGLKPEDFPWIQEGGFQPSPPHLSRTGTSIYRSVAKRAMGYDAASGDRILILVCPRDQWPGLRLHWPAPTPD